MTGAERDEEGEGTKRREDDGPIEKQKKAIVAVEGREHSAQGHKEQTHTGRQIIVLKGDSLLI